MNEPKKPKDLDQVAPQRKASPPKAASPKATPKKAPPRKKGARRAATPRARKAPRPDGWPEWKFPRYGASFAGVIFAREIISRDSAPPHAIIAWDGARALAL
jgi:hypothetical protein